VKLCDEGMFELDPRPGDDRFIGCEEAALSQVFEEMSKHSRFTILVDPMSMS